jgi:Pyruvate/2-oxoglutarate dehydrogenase complex, dihydrolipoamide acyltransferase (E2) component, and related enzymes
MIDVLLPQTPVCWETCGNCAGEMIVGEICVKVGDTVRRDDTLIVLETNKVALDIPAPSDGIVREILVREGATIHENDVIMRIEEATAKNKLRVKTNNNKNVFRFLE